MSRAAPHLTADWPLRCEISRLEARVGHLTERVAQDVARLSSLRASRAKAHATTLELQRVIRAAAGAEPTDRVVALSHSGRLLAAIVAEVEELRARVAPLDVAQAAAEAAVAAASAKVAAAEADVLAAVRGRASAERVAASVPELLERARVAERAEAAATKRAVAAEKTLRRAQHSISAREGAVEQRVRAAQVEVERTKAAADAEHAEAKAERAAQDEWHRVRIEALESELKAAMAAAKRAKRAEHTMQAAIDIERAKRELAERTAARAVAAAKAAAKVEPAPAPPPALALGKAPAAPLLSLLATGPKSVSRHGLRLKVWAATGSTPAVEAARWLAASLDGPALSGEARMAALTGLAGLLGGV